MKTPSVIRIVITRRC